jgi:hypothetical protein
MKAIYLFHKKIVGLIMRKIRRILAISHISHLVLRQWYRFFLFQNDWSIEQKRMRTLHYVASMQMQKSGLGHYRYSESQRQPVLYASTYAVLTRHLYGDLDCLSDRLGLLVRWRETTMDRIYFFLSVR